MAYKLKYLSWEKWELTNKTIENIDTQITIPLTKKLNVRKAKKK